MKFPDDGLPIAVVNAALTITRWAACNNFKVYSVCGIGPNSDEALAEKYRNRLDDEQKSNEQWRSKAVAADLTRNLREQEIIDLRNQLRYAATRLNVKHGETDKMRRTLDEALTLIQSYRLAEEDYLEKLDEQEHYIELLKGIREKQNHNICKLYEWKFKLEDRVEALELENARLKWPLWVKIVGWFAR